MPRAWRVVLVGGVMFGATFGVACSTPSPRPGGPPSGARDGGWVDRATPPPPRTTSTASPVPVAPWDLEEQLRAARPAVPRARSGHLTGELEAEVVAAGAGSYPVLGPESRLPVGATLIQRLFEPGHAAPVAYFAMVKRAAGFDAGGGDWEYLVLSGSGQTEQRGPLPLCARCHAEAPHDRLFGRGR